jgi:salicylate hydroxylase
LRYYRPDVLRVLIDHLPENVPTHFGRRLSTYRRLANGKIELQFDDGSVTTCDILIGSDGVRSTVRRDMLTSQAQEATDAGRADEADAILRGIEPSWTGIVAYRALVPTERLLAYRDTHPEEKVRIPEHNSIPVMVSNLSY